MRPLFNLWSRYDNELYIYNTYFITTIHRGSGTGGDYGFNTLNN